MSVVKRVCRHCQIAFWVSREGRGHKISLCWETTALVSLEISFVELFCSDIPIKESLLTLPRLQYTQSDKLIYLREPCCESQILSVLPHLHRRTTKAASASQWWWWTPQGPHRADVLKNNCFQRAAIKRNYLSTRKGWDQKFPPIILLQHAKSGSLSTPPQPLTSPFAPPHPRTPLAEMYRRQREKG